MTDQNDLWDKLDENSTRKEYVYFGQANFNIYEAAWDNNALVAWNPQLHQENVLAIEIDIKPVAGSPGPKYPQKTTERSIDWYKKTLPSIEQNLKITRKNVGRELHGRYVKAAGTIYEHTKNDGTIKKFYPLVFLEMYPDEATCKAASDAFHTQQHNGNDDPQRKVALQFLPHLVKQSKGDLSVLAELIKQNNLIAQYFDVDSPETKTELAKLPEVPF